MKGVINNFSPRNLKVEIVNEKGTPYWYLVPNNNTDLKAIFDQGYATVGQEIDFNYDFNKETKTSTLKSFMLGKVIKDYKQIVVPKKDDIDAYIPDKVLDQIKNTKQPMTYAEEQELRNFKIETEWAYKVAVPMAIAIINDKCAMSTKGFDFETELLKKVDELQYYMIDELNKRIKQVEELK